ncbi:MAG TPA: hypothetical protein VEV41_22135 [Terriglobales bacterium]|nr:hypothetical protein [Terriglobales bacterium]
MKVGTKSVIGGAHCFLLHPFFVAWGWKRLFGFPWDPHLWFAFALHDIGYIGRGDMDGPEGEEHVVLGARIMGSLFGPVWEDECLRHSRYWSRRMGLPISRLCLADKMAFALTPAWLYLPMTRWTGELREYMTRSRQRQAGDNSFTSEEEMLVRAEVPEQWLRGLQSYTLRWVERHRDQYVTRRVAAPGVLAPEPAGGRDVPSNEAEAVRLR